MEARRARSAIVRILDSGDRMGWRHLRLSGFVSLALLLALLPGAAFAAVPTVVTPGWSSVAPAPAPGDLKAVMFLDGSTGWAVGAGGTILKTMDGGATWAAQVSGTTTNLSSVDFVSATTGWTVGPGTILKTTNGGDSWSPQNVGNDSSYLAVDFVDATTGYVLTSWGGLFKTVDGGEHWTLSQPTQSYQTSCQFWDASTGWLTTDQNVNGGIFKTTDGGASWTRLSTGFVWTFSDVHFINGSMGWGVGTMGDILRTTDGGATWLRTIGTQPLAGVDFVDAMNGWAVGANGTILKSTDGGVTWAAQSSGTSTGLRGIDAVSVLGAVSVGDAGTMLRTTTGGSPAYGPEGSVFRFYNGRNGTHFYTADTTEMLSVYSRLGAIYGFEGVAYCVNSKNPANSAALHRFYNARKGTHFYTADPAEKARVQTTMASTYSYDGPAYNVSLSYVPGASTVWRFYNRKTGTHFYTADAAEKANVQNNLRSIYSLDGPAFYLAP